MTGRATTTFRTQAQVEAEYTAARAAYLKALDAEALSVSHAVGGHSITRAGIDTLRNHMLALERELYDIAQAKPKIRVRGVTPVG